MIYDDDRIEIEVDTGDNEFAHRIFLKLMVIASQANRPSDRKATRILAAARYFQNKYASVT